MNFVDRVLPKHLVNLQLVNSLSINGLCERVAWMDVYVEVLHTCDSDTLVSEGVGGFEYR